MTLGWLALFFGLPLCLTCQLVAPPSAGKDYKISLNVDLVLLDVTVVNAKGKFVPGLAKENFHVYEDGRLQKIKSFRQQDVPATVGLVVDGSGSMRMKRRQIVAASVAFADSSNPADEMFVVSFNEHVSLGLPEGTEFTSDPEQLRLALTRTPPAGMTALYDAIAEGLEQMKKARCQRKALIVVSDGGDNTSHHSFRQVLELARLSNVTIYTIGLLDEYDEDDNPSVLKRLAKESGGLVFLPRSVENVLEITRRIAADIRNQYTIGYVPANTQDDGKYRKLRVVVKAPGHGKLLARTRTGYYLSGSGNTR